MRKKTRIDPPLYLASTTISCWRCGADMPVVGLIAPNVPEAAGEVCTPFDITELPDVVLSFIQKRFPTFKRKFSKTTRSEYLANTCPKCGMISGDFYLHSEPGGSFFPTTKQEAQRLTLELMSAQYSIEVRAGFGMGTGDLILKSGKRRSAEQGSAGEPGAPDV
jgi:ribosomal protein S27E